MLARLFVLINIKSCVNNALAELLGLFGGYLKNLLRV